MSSGATSTTTGASSGTTGTGSASTGGTGSTTGTTGGSGGTGTTGGTGGAGGTGGTGSGGGGSQTSTIPTLQHVVIVVLENTNYSDVVGSASMPYLNGLIGQGAVAANYYANAHPSIGNYFVLTSGLDYTNDDSFQGVVDIDNVVRELNAAGKSWKAYAENLPSSGYLGGDAFPYFRHHNPFVYFSDVQPPATAAANIVPYSQINTDLANDQLPAYSFIIPNAWDDAHSCPGETSSKCALSVRLSTADQWLSNNLPAILNNSGFQQSGLLVVTFDESRNDNTNGGGKVFTLLLGTKVKGGYVGTGTYDHRSLLDLSMTVLGVTANINGADGASQMTEFFQP